MKITHTWPVCMWWTFWWWNWRCITSFLIILQKGHRFSILYMSMHFDYKEKYISTTPVTEMAGSIWKWHPEFFALNPLSVSSPRYFVLPAINHICGLCLGWCLGWSGHQTFVWIVEPCVFPTEAIESVLTRVWNVPHPPFQYAKNLFFCPCKSVCGHRGLKCVQ